jgi:hypothetical protein
MSQTRAGSVTNFDSWKHSYAARAANLSVSEVRALFAVVSRPEVVSLAGGMPDVSALDKNLIEQAFNSMMARRGDYALQYGGGQGDLRLREQIQEIMELDGVHGSVEDIMITTGSQHALELLADLFLDAGDVVFVEAPSYVGAVGIFRHKEAHIQHVFTDDDGISPEALAEEADRLSAEGKKLKLLYLVPNFANPSGVTLSAERRQQVLQVCDLRCIRWHRCPEAYRSSASRSGSQTWCRLQTKRHRSRGSDSYPHAFHRATHRCRRAQFRPFEARDIQTLRVRFSTARRFYILRISLKPSLILFITV